MVTFYLVRERTNMYPVKYGYQEAVRRINALIENEHHAEALVTSVFTIEKTLRRTLRALIISSGFPSSQATILMSKFDGLNKIKDVWSCFDTSHKKLTDFLPPTTIQAMAETQTKRNHLVHGVKVYKLSECKQEAEKALSVLDIIVTEFNNRYGFDGWTKIKGRKISTLHNKPRVKMPT